MQSTSALCVFYSAHFLLLSQIMESVPIPPCWSGWVGYRMRSRPVVIHSILRLPWLTNSTQAGGSTTDVTEWRKTQINFLFTSQPNLDEYGIKTCYGAFVVFKFKLVDEVFWWNQEAETSKKLNHMWMTFRLMSFVISLLRGIKGKASHQRGTCSLLKTLQM